MRTCGEHPPEYADVCLACGFLRRPSLWQQLMDWCVPADALRWDREIVRKRWGDPWQAEPQTLTRP